MASRGAGRRKTLIQGQFAWRLIEMLESPAYRALSLSAHKVLSRLEVELAHHGGEKGRENGRLIVTYDDFTRYGMDRHAIGPAISECVALGFLQITELGCAGNEQFRRPNRFRLTFRHGSDGSAPTDEWRIIDTLDKAVALAAAARTTRRENRSPVGVNAKSQWGKPPLKSKFPVGRTPTTGPVGITPTTIDISVGFEHDDASASGTPSNIVGVSE